MRGMLSSAVSVNATSNVYLRPESTIDDNDGQKAGKEGKEIQTHGAEAA